MTCFRHATTVVSLIAAAVPALAAEPDVRRPQEPLEEVVIIAPYGTALSRDRIAANVQSADAEQIERAQTLDITDFLNRNFASVSINHAQNNPLQPDVNFRGFTASPLLGLPMGLTVYQNGVRVNEPFGDTVSWDLIPLSAVSSMQLMAGANPVFGLNTLGGALAVRMKNGFNYEGSSAQLYGGSFSRRGGSIERGGNNGRWGYYGNIDYFEEDGWRDFSDSDALRFFGVVSLRGNSDSSLDVSVAYADTELRGNGASPVELLSIDRAQVFTHPDLTRNRLAQVIVEGERTLTGPWRISGNLFYRDIDTDTFNGDGTPFEECEFDDEEILVEEDFDDLNGDGECSFADDAGIVPVLGADGEPLEAELDDVELNAVNNIGRRAQEIYGASVQLGMRSGTNGRERIVTLGAAYTDSRTAYNSIVEVANLLEDRSTSRTGIFAENLRTDMRSDLSTASVYFSATQGFSERVAVTLSGRYDSTRVRLRDRGGNSPELNGSHDFERFNPAAGITVRLTPAVTLYGSLSQSARAPTPVELACASEDAPCNLPNAFLADPPLEQVVATSAEAGIRGTYAGNLRWHAGVFHTTNDDDILFQTTGGPQANVGFFANVGDTRRAGVELGISQRLSRLRWAIDYSYVDATFEDDFVVNSPNHPVFEDGDSPAIVGERKLLVTKGSTIPGIPRHQANVRVDYTFGDRFTIGADAVLRSGVYLRGDEPNLLGKTKSYTILNVRGEYRLSQRVRLLARIENLLDEDYETFGLLGEPDEVFENFEDPRFFGAGPPFGAWAGIRVDL